MGSKAALARQHDPDRPQLVRPVEADITWSHYPRIEPGEYEAVSRRANVYFDRSFKRHICCVWFAIGTERVKLPWFLNLGSGDEPKVGRRSNYWLAWIQANGDKSPMRGDRLSPRIFENRAATVLVGDTAMNFRGDQKFLPYSTIRKVIGWETN